MLIQSNGSSVATDRVVRCGRLKGVGIGVLPVWGGDLTYGGRAREVWDVYAGEFESSSGLAGLDYANQRYYSSVYGRFTSADGHLSTDGASDPGSWNRYAYAGGDPANAGDPSGMVKFSCSDPNAASIYDGSCIVGSGSYGYGIECGFDWDFGFLYNGCSAFYFVPGAAARAGGADNSHKAPPQPVRSSCSISLYERPVSVPGVGLLADHTYLLVQDPIGESTTIEGGPDLINIPLGYLIGTFSTPPGHGLEGTNPLASGNKQVGPSDSGSRVCAAALAVESAGSRYNSSGRWAKYDPLAMVGYNSNSFTYTLLNDVGLSTFFGLRSAGRLAGDRLCLA